MMRVISLVFARDNLRLLKLKAKRCGVWFKALSSVDRALVNLTLRVADRVRSLRLARALLKVLVKIRDAVESRISRAVREIGFPLACRIGLLAKRWGNPEGESWMSDAFFARFLAVMHVNGNYGRSW